MQVVKQLDVLANLGPAHSSDLILDVLSKFTSTGTCSLVLDNASVAVTTCVWERNIILIFQIPFFWMILMYLIKKIALKIATQIRCLVKRSC